MKKLVAYEPMKDASSIEDVYFGFTQGAPEMDGKTFVKLAKDCVLIDKNLTTTDIDIIFAKVKSKGARKLSYNQFLSAIDEIASKKGVTAAKLS